MAKVSDLYAELWIGNAYWQTVPWNGKTSYIKIPWTRPLAINLHEGDILQESVTYRVMVFENCYYTPGRYERFYLVEV